MTEQNLARKVTHDLPRSMRNVESPLSGSKGRKSLSARASCRSVSYATAPGSSWWNSVGRAPIFTWYKPSMDATVSVSHTVQLAGSAIRLAIRQTWMPTPFLHIFFDLRIKRLIILIRAQIFSAVPQKLLSSITYNFEPQRKTKRPQSVEDVFPPFRVTEIESNCPFVSAEIAKLISRTQNI